MIKAFGKDLVLGTRHKLCFPYRFPSGLCIEQTDSKTKPMMVFIGKLSILLSNICVKIWVVSMIYVAFIISFQHYNLKFSHGRNWKVKVVHLHYQIVCREFPQTTSIPCVWLREQGSTVKPKSDLTSLKTPWTWPLWYTISCNWKHAGDNVTKMFSYVSQT